MSLMTAGMTGRLQPSPAAPAFAVRRLVLTDFRGYGAARLAVDGRAVVLTGPNGAGKTNLLEAISMLAPGRGLRRARLSEMDRRSADTEGGAAWAVAATLATPAGAVEIGTGRDAAHGERRLVRIDGEPVRGHAALARHVAMVWLTPQMDRLFLEGPSARRRFLDRLVYGFDPDHAGRVAAYEQALRERARLLRQGGADPAWLSALEDTMARYGVAVAAARRSTAERLNRARGSGSGFPNAVLSAAGSVEDRLATTPAVETEAWLRAALAAARRQDAETGGAALGPHRSDMRACRLSDGAAAETCSTGEQKALLIAIVLAHARLQAAERGAPPILLLDEVAAHLDAKRRAMLFAALEDLAAQAWLTGTDAETFAPLTSTAQFIAVAEARLGPAPRMDA